MKREIKVNEAALGRKGYKGKRVLLGLKVYRENKVLLVHRVFKVILGLKVFKVTPVLLVHKVKKETKVTPYGKVFGQTQTLTLKEIKSTGMIIHGNLFAH